MGGCQSSSKRRPKKSVSTAPSFYHHSCCHQDFLQQIPSELVNQTCLNQYCHCRDYTRPITQQYSIQQLSHYNAASQHDLNYYNQIQPFEQQQIYDTHTYLQPRVARQSSARARRRIVKRRQSSFIFKGLKSQRQTQTDHESTKRFVIKPTVELYSSLAGGDDSGSPDENRSTFAESDYQYYNQLQANACQKNQLLPLPIVMMSGRRFSFTAVGHLIHINLKENLMKHKNDIGKAILDKNKRALAVVNKVNTIDNEFRNFEIEFIAKREGCTKTEEELLVVEVNENKCRYQFDFSKVYWNSRLSTEHERIFNSITKPNDIVFDLCAGVGPFSIPAAKAKCKVYANDLNPEAVKWLKENSKRNKINPTNLMIFNKDARRFIRQELKEYLIKEYSIIKDEELAILPKFHILMNLPALALTFLPCFIGLFREPTATYDKQELINLFTEINCEHIVYCYCFLKGLHDDPLEKVKNMAEETMERKLDDQIIEIQRVRNVAPYKEMYRLKLKLDESILFDTETDIDKFIPKPTKSSMIVTPLMNSTSPVKTVRFKRTINDRDDSSIDSSSENDSKQNGSSNDVSPPKEKRFRPSCNII